MCISSLTKTNSGLETHSRFTRILQQMSKKEISSKLAMQQDVNSISQKKNVLDPLWTVDGDIYLVLAMLRMEEPLIITSP